MARFNCASIRSHSWAKSFGWRSGITVRQGVVAQFLTHALWLGVRGYRIVLAPFLGGRCRFYPSCSVLAQEALETMPFFAACQRIVSRLLRCHPWHPGGPDPTQPSSRT